MKPKLNDAKWKELRRKVIEMAAGSHVKVGVLADKGGDQTTDGGITLVELAAIHEYGSPAANIPERSFIRRTFDAEKARELAAMQGKLVGAIVEGKMSVPRALELLGQWAAAAVKKTITSGPHIPPPLKPATVAAKGSDRPLVDTGQLVNSITYKVEVGRGTGEQA